jgi:hypothetical protein
MLPVLDYLGEILVRSRCMCELTLRACDRQQVQVD